MTSGRGGGSKYRWQRRYPEYKARWNPRGLRDFDEWSTIVKLPSGRAKTVPLSSLYFYHGETRGNARLAREPGKTSDAALSIWYFLAFESSFPFLSFVDRIIDIIPIRLGSRWNDLAYWTSKLYLWMNIHRFYVPADFDSWLVNKDNSEVIIVRNHIR